MELALKSDVEEAREFWIDFWRGTNMRPALGIALSKSVGEPLEMPNRYLCAHGDLDMIINRVLAWASSYDWLFEAIPGYQISFNPDHFSALLGAEIRFHPDSPNTSWIEPFVRDWDKAEIVFRRDCFWWKRTVECIRRFRERCDGKILVYGPHLQGGLDCLAAIRGVENLLLDLVMTPESVRSALDAVNRAVDEVRSALADELNCRQFGSMTRHGMYSPGLIDVPQCDFSAMISPEMFREFALPSLRHEANALAGAIYHLDGPDAIKHLEAICELESISVVQWQPGAGEAAAKDWMALHERIDSFGKGQVLGGDPATIRRMRRVLSSKRLYFSATVSSRDEAESLLRDLEGTGE